MKKRDCKISLIVSTYNWVEALELTLLSILNQKELPLEVIIADDGSTHETKQLINRFKSLFNIPLVHVWHKDDGFRLAEIRNKAISSAKGNYIVQIDGDIIIDPYFILDHRKFAKKNTFVRASRIYLNEELSQKAFIDKKIIFSPFTKGISNSFSAFRAPFLSFIFAENYKVKGDELWEIHGCNMAFWKDNALRVNGYNEEFIGWGPEDKEFVARLLNAGFKKRFLKLGGIAYHINHPINNKMLLKHNEAIFHNTKKNKVAFCNKGINKYISEDSSINIDI